MTCVSTSFCPEKLPQKINGSSPKTPNKTTPSLYPSRADRETAKQVLIVVLEPFPFPRFSPFEESLLLEMTAAKRNMPLPQVAGIE